MPLDKDLRSGLRWGGGQGQREPRDWMQGSRSLPCDCPEPESVPGAGTQGRGGRRRGKGHVTWFDSVF